MRRSCTLPIPFRIRFLSALHRLEGSLHSNTAFRHIRKSTPFPSRHTGNPYSGFPMSGVQDFRLNNSSYTSFRRISSAYEVRLLRICSLLSLRFCMMWQVRVRSSM